MGFHVGYSVLLLPRLFLHTLFLITFANSFPLSSSVWVSQISSNPTFPGVTRPKPTLPPSLPLPLAAASPSQLSSSVNSYPSSSFPTSSTRQTAAPFVCTTLKGRMRSGSWRIVDIYSIGAVWTVGWDMIRKHVRFVEHVLFLMICKIHLMRGFGLLLGSLNSWVIILKLLLCSYSCQL